MKQCTIKYVSNLSVYGLVAALVYLFMIGSLGAGKKYFHESREGVYLYL